MKIATKTAAGTLAMLVASIAGPWVAPAPAATTDDEPQSITFTSTAPDPGVVGGTYLASAVGGASGNPVTFSLGAGTTAGACTVTDQGDGTASVALLAAGTCEVAADQAATEGYEAAPTAVQSFALEAPQSQTITFTSTAPAPGLVGGTYVAAAEGGASGNPVTFSVGAGTTGGACTVTDQGDGTASVALFAAGTCQVAADQAADEGYEAAPTAVQSFPVRQTQTVSFTSSPPAPAYVNGSWLADTTSDSGGAVTIGIDGSSTTGACSILGTKRIGFTGVGTCVVVADQVGDSRYAAARAVVTFSISNREQVIRFLTTAPTAPGVGAVYKVKAQGGASGNDVRFSVDTSDAGACTVVRTGATSAKVTFTGRGTCRLAADQAGVAGYDAAATVTQVVTVPGKAQSVVFTTKAPTRPMIGQTYLVSARGGASGKPVTFSIDPASAPGACTVDAGTGTATVTFTARSACVIAADQAGDSTYAPAVRVRQTTTVAGTPQKVTITSVKPKSSPVDSDYTVTGTGGGSGQALTFRVDASTTNDACELDGSSTATSAGVLFRHTGTCVIAVGQPGDSVHDPAPEVLVTYTVSAAPQVIVYDAAPPSSATTAQVVEVRAHGGGSGEAVRFAIDSASASVCSVEDQVAADGSPSSSTGVLRFATTGKCVLVASQAGSIDYAPGSLKRTITVKR